MADLVAIIKGGLSDLSRPLGGFLFVGPTGVGKTEAAKALAQYLFASEARLLRFDMSEYVGPDAIHRFLGTRAEEGKLVEAIRKQPFSVVLLDEIEKADSAIFDVLLQVLGEARLTDEAGRTADFKNAVVILTSNLGVESFSAGVGIDREPTAEEYHAHFVKEAERFFRPELFNRLDHVISFHPLEAEAISRITTRELDKLRRREGIRSRGVSLELGPEVHAWLASRGVDPRYGARPLKRVIDRSLAMPLARHLSRHREDRALVVRPAEEGLAFERTSAGGTGEVTRAKAEIEARLSRLDDVRYRLSRWMQSPAYRELEHELHLLDQLSKNRHFWSDRVRAEARTRSMQSQLDLRELFEGLARQLADLEDVALESLFDLDVAPLGMLDDELSLAQARLSDAELELFCTRYEDPNAVLVYLRPHEGAERFLRSLIEVYADLAVKKGWTVRASGALELAPDEVARAKAPPRSPPKAKKGDKPEPTKRKKARPRGPRRFSWRHLGPRLDPAWIEGLSEGGSPGSTYAKAIEAAITEHRFVALEVRGPFARAWLDFEHGLHVEVRTERREVRVCVRDGGTSLEHPVDLPWSTRLRRLVHHGRSVVEDPVLGWHVAARATLWPAYVELMRAGVYVATFGARGVEWAKRWGQT